MARKRGLASWCYAVLTLALPLRVLARPLGSEFQVNTYSTNAQRYPSLAVDAEGDFVVVWESYTEDGSGFGIFARRFSSAGGPQASEFQVNLFTTTHQGEATVAADSDGDFVVVWRSNSQDATLYGVFARRF